MAATICPTVTANNDQQYKSQLDKLLAFASRVHIDLADGIFTTTKLTSVDKVWWPANVRADLHIMHQKPFVHNKLFVKLAPQLVVVHAEAEGDFASFADLMHSKGIEVGVALKPETPAELIKPALELIDHVLIFSGHLGHFGGQADLSLLDKVQLLKSWKPRLEIGWDGGINDQNVRSLVMGGVEVLNTGGYIQHANDPAAAFRKLQSLVQ